MKPFRFSLQAVLTIRANQERKALEAFARAQAALQQAEALRRAVQDDIDDLYAARREVFRGMAASESLHQMQQGMRALKERFAAAQAEVEKTQKMADGKSRELLDARQKREVVEKLYHKRKATHDAEALRAEQRLMDDFATLKSVGGIALKWQ